MKFAAIYVRVSTEEQTADNQIPECMQLARARRLEDARVFEEIESGAATERPVWQSVMTAAHRGELSAVVVWSLDRIGRTMWQVVRDVRELDRLGVPLVSVRESWCDTTSPMIRELLISVMGWVAQHERDRLRERTRAGLERARSRGQVLGRPAQVPREVVLRAAQIRRTCEADCHGPPHSPPRSWGRVAHTLACEGLGNWNRSTLANAVAALLEKGDQKPHDEGP